jgi:hypothetical protein
MGLIKIGSDPELFMRQGGRFISAYGHVQGDKEHPFPVKDGAVQVDGMALEFNIDPAETEERFVGNINSVMAQLKAMVPDYELVAAPVAHFGAEYIAAQPYEARELGCDPDYSAYTGRQNPVPDEDLPFRTGAGHIHLGWCEQADEASHMDDCIAVIRQMDFYLGLPSLMYDKDTERRGMYGKAGAFRPKPYGVEYRTLSNAWLSNEMYISWVYRAAQEGMNQLTNGNALEYKYGDIQDIINNSDVEAALEIITAEKLEVPYVG